MVSSLPPRIMNYNVSPSSPTDELLTLGRIFSEVGDYASTILDRKHISLSRQCKTRLNKVVAELIARQCILTAQNLYDRLPTAPSGSDLKSLSIDDLHRLYRRWPTRHNDRRADGRESMTFYYEGRIVREMMSRKPANKGEQLKVDYCVTTYRNELDNMSFGFSIPVKVERKHILPEYGRKYTPEQLTAFVSLYKDYRDIAGREILVEYVDIALDLLKQVNDATPCLGLLSEITELGRRRIIHVPEWVTNELEETVKKALASKTGNDTDLPLPLLTLHLVNKDLSLQHKAQRIINRCYKSAFDSMIDLNKRIECLHTAVTCCDYVTGFSIRKSATAWNELTSQALSADKRLNPGQIFRLLEVAKECEDYSTILPEAKNKLKRMLDDMTQSDCPEAKALNEIVKRRF